MGVLGILSLIITIAGYIIKIASKSSDYAQSNSDDLTYNPSEKEKLQDIYDKNLNNCYKSSKILNFNIKKTDTLLRGYQYNGYVISDVIVKKNCAYIEFNFPEQYIGLDYNNNKIPSVRIKQSYFSINYVEPNDNVIIYGSIPFETETQNSLHRIADDIINELSK
jgi:hypothetical protein